MIRKIKLLFIELLILFLGLFSSRSRNKKTATSFEVDPKVQKIAAAYADDCVNWVAENSIGCVDYEDRNIIAIEDFLEGLYKHSQKNPLTGERKEIFTKMFGFYIGEVYRRNHGNVDWGWASINGEKCHALGNVKSGGAFFWPIKKVQKRIELGPEENVLHYYQTLVANKI